MRIWILVSLMAIAFCATTDKIFLGNTNMIKKELYNKQNIKGVSRYSIKLSSSEKAYAYMTYGKPLMFVFDYPIVQSIPSPPSYFKTIAYHAGSNYITIMPVAKMTEEFDGAILHITLHRGDGIPDLVYTIEVVICKLGHENDRIRIYSDDEDFYNQKKVENEKETTEIRKKMKSYQDSLGLSLLGKDELELDYDLDTTYNGMKLTLKRIMVSEISNLDTFYKFLIEVNKPKDLELSLIQENTKVIFEEIDTGKRSKYYPSVVNLDFNGKNYLLFGFSDKAFKGEVVFELLLDGSRISGEANLKSMDIKQDNLFKVGF